MDEPQAPTVIHTRASKFSQASHPAVRAMLTGDRVAALERTLAIVALHEGLSTSPEEAERWRAKRREVKALLAQARRSQEGDKRP